MKEKIELSIIIPTLGRKDDIDSLLQSIVRTQRNVSYEVVVVDQNQDGLIDEIVAKYQNTLRIQHHKVLFQGLSKARNYGTAHSAGEILCYPDDDAQFSRKTISAAVKKLKAANADCVFGKCIDKKTGKDTLIHFPKKEKVLSLSNFENSFIECTIFVKRKCAETYVYDENMGIGTIHGAQEGYDAVYRMLKGGCRLVYDPEILFYHPEKKGNRRNEWEIHRAFYYSCGLGYLCKKHGFRKKYSRRALKLSFAMPFVAVFRRHEWKYFFAQWMGLRLGYKYI